MAVCTFVIVETFVTPDNGGEGSGPHASPIGRYSAALKGHLSQFWEQMSGGRVEVRWAADRQFTVSQRLEEWSLLSAQQKCDALKAQARIPDDQHVILLANDAGTPFAHFHPGSGIYVHVAWLSPNVVAHEMGHFFLWYGNHIFGHADLAREFFRDEYADDTCVMGGRNHPLTFTNPAISELPGIPHSQQSGPGMNPALVAQCGWLNLASPLVDRIHAASLRPTKPLHPWRGAPGDLRTQGAPVVACVDGIDADGGRLYLCLRHASDWDRQFTDLSQPTVPADADLTLRLIAYLNTPSGDSIRLGWSHVAEGQQMILGRVPLRVTIARVSPEGVTLSLEPSAWRSSAVLEGVACHPSAKIAAAAAGGRADLYVIDVDGAVRFNHFNGHGWEFRPWPVLDGITCDPTGGIAAVARREGHVDVFVVDTAGVVHRKRRTHTQWSDWEPLAGGELHATSPLAVARIDDDIVLLCGVRPDNQVTRVDVDDAGVRFDWTPAPDLAVTHVAATSDDTYRGRLYGVRTPQRDRSLWVTPDLTAPDVRFWSPVSALTFQPERPVAATQMAGAHDVVVIGTDPLRLLRWSGAEWVEESLGDTNRRRNGGIAVFSREPESCEIAYIARDGQVNIASWSPRTDFRPAMNQYEAQSMVLIASATGHFVQAKNGGGDGISADAQQIGPWERFRLLECQTVVIDGGAQRRLVAFQTHNGHYVGAVGGGGSHLVAEARVVGPWELFYMDTLPGGTGKVTLGCIDEVHYWTAHGGGGAALAADRREPREWETFIIVPTSG
jgi:hypothetical protein